MGFFSWLDPEGEAREQLIEQQEFSRQNQAEAKPQPKAATPGKQLPKNEQKQGGGTLYSASTTPSGRVHTEQIVKKETKGSPLADIARDVLEQKQYVNAEGNKIDPNDPSFKHAPTLARAYGIDKSEPGWGMKGYGGKIVGGLLRGIAPVVAGGLMGGKKGAMAAWGEAVQERRAQAEQERKQLADVSSDKTMREAYEMARMNYESDYNMGKTDVPFGDYLAQALEAMGTNYSGSLGTLISIYGPEEGYKKYLEMKTYGRGGGSGRGVTYETREGIDPVTGEVVRRKVPVSGDPLVGKTVVKTGPTGTNVTTTGRPPLSQFNK